MFTFLKLLASAYISVIKDQLSESQLQWIGGPNHIQIQIPNIKPQLQKN